MSGIVTKHQLEQFIQNGRNKKDREYVLVDVREPSVCSLRFVDNS